RPRTASLIPYPTLFRASDFHYLTGFNEPDAVLVLDGSAERERTVMFVQPRDPERETWTGRRAGVEGAIEQYGADAAYPMDELVQDRKSTRLNSSHVKIS